jgi:hypothetical protein
VQKTGEKASEQRLTAAVRALLAAIEAEPVPDRIRELAIALENALQKGGKSD